MALLISEAELKRKLLLKLQQVVMALEEQVVMPP